MTRDKPAGPYLDGYHRYWMSGEGPYLSVTTATSVLDKPALDMWRVNMTAAYAIDHLAELAEMAQFDPPGALRAVKSATEATRVDSAEFGTAVHALIHEYVTGTEHPVVQIGSDEEKFLFAYACFANDYEVRGVGFASELPVFNDSYMTAGTVDRIVYASGLLAERLHVEVGDLVMLDYKTGKSSYPETEIQLAGYSQMRYFGKPDDPVKHQMPGISAHAVLHIRPHEYEGGHDEGYKLLPHHVTRDSIGLFRACVSLKRWQQEQDRKYRASRKDAA